MGLLDDAIREHLDLKRRRGADPTEIERAEQEALGPVRRDPFERGPADFESAPGADDGVGAYDQEEGPYDDEGYEEYYEEEWEEDFEQHPVEPVAPANGAGESPGPREGDFSDPTRLMDHEALDELQPRSPDAPSATPPYEAEAGAGDETMQYDVDEALAAESGRAEPGADWVERSEDWEEPSSEPAESPHEPLEPSHEPAEPPPADKSPTFEPPPADKSPTFETPPGEQEPPHHSESDVVEPGIESDAPYDDVHGDPETGPQRAKPDDDVLEETPESLQDAPDHDRLWFEQRPPKDFDFDG
jgi:hypothetical protein